jgi:hypothetical protein
VHGVDAIAVTNSEANEYFLFHGCPSERVETICGSGFDPRRAGSTAGMMFGMGTYFAHNSSKADLYAKPTASQPGLRCVFLTRVCLGEPFFCTRNSMGAEDMRELKMPPERPDKRGPCNSVVGETQSAEGHVMFREYIVYDRNQAVPEFLIWYKHKVDCECSQCDL